MKSSKKAIIAICLVLGLNIGCSKKEIYDRLSMNNIEHDIPYINFGQSE